MGFCGITGFYGMDKIHENQHFYLNSFENKDQGPQRIALNNNFNLEISLLFYSKKGTAVISE